MLKLKIDKTLCFCSIQKHQIGKTTIDKTFHPVRRPVYQFGKYAMNISGGIFVFFSPVFNNHCDHRKRREKHYAGQQLIILRNIPWIGKNFNKDNDNLIHTCRSEKYPTYTYQNKHGQNLENVTCF